MEPHPKRIKPTKIVDTNGKHPSAIETNTDLYNKLLDSYGEIFKTTVTPPIRERLIAKAQLNFQNCSTSFKQSSELRRLLQNQDSLQPLQHLEVIFKKFKANKKSSAAKSSTPKKDNGTPVENDAVSSEIYNKDLFEKFLDIVKERKNSKGNYAETEKFMIRAWTLFNNCKSSYKKSSAFEDLLRKAIDLSTVDISIQLKTVLDELKFNKKVVSQQPVETRVNEPGCSTSMAQEATEVKTGENDSDDDDGLSGLDPQVKKKVKVLERTLRALNLRIRHLEEREVDFSRDDDENSAYMKLDRYYRRFDQVYAKICQLKKQKSDAGRVVKRKVSFPGGEIEKAIEKHYNKTNLFPDFHDILKITKEVKKNENLPPNALHTIAQKVFEEFGKMLQRRRQMDVYESACAYLTNSDPAEQDPELMARLEENYVKFKDSEKKVLDMFAEKSQGIEAEEVGSNVSNDEDETRECDSDESSDPGKQESTVLDETAAEEDECVVDKVDNAESKEKMQCGSDSDIKRENKAECTPENSSNACYKSKDTIVSKDSECVNTEGKEPELILAPRKDVSGDEVESGISLNVEGSVKVSGFTSPVKVKGQESHGLTTEKEKEIDSVKPSNFSSTGDRSVTKNCGTVDFEKKESCSLTRRKEKGEKKECFSPKKGKQDKKIESSIGVSLKLGSKKGVSIIEGSKSCEESQSCSFTHRKEKLDSSPTKSNSLGCSTKEILVSEDCKSKNADKNSCSLASRKIDSDETVPNENIETHSSPSKSVAISNNDENVNKSESNERERSEKKRKNPCENVGEDKPENKRPKISEHHSSSNGVKCSTSLTDRIRVIDVEVLRRSSTLTNKENVKKLNNLDQKNATKTDKKQLRTVSDGDEKKKYNPSSVDYCPKKVVSMGNGSTVKCVNSSSSTNVAGVRNGATSSPISNKHSVHSAGASHVPSSNKHSVHSAGASHVKNSSTNVNRRPSNASVANSRSTNHSWRQKTPASYSSFSNSCKNTSSPIITAAYSLAKPSGNSSTSKHNFAPLPHGHNHQQKRDKTSWSEAVNKYRTPRTSSTSKFSSSSITKSKDVIVIDEGEDDLCIISEVRSSTKKPGNLEASSSHHLTTASSKLLDGNTIKYISEEKTKEMLKHGNVKLFSRFKTNPPSDELETDSVITLD